MAATRLRTKLVGNLSDAEYRACARLNLRGNGEMAELLRWAWDNCPWESRVILIDERESGQLLAWALVVPDRGPRHPLRADFYVRRSHRRQGLGQRLLRAVSRLERRPRVCGWDARSRAFYRAYGLKRLVISYRT